MGLRVLEFRVLGFRDQVTILQGYIGFRVKELTLSYHNEYTGFRVYRLYVGYIGFRF